MPLWPFCPSPLISESLLWNSVVTNPRATQQVAQMVSVPRQGFDFTHTFTFRQMERAQLLMENAAAGDWDLPLWHERQRVSVGSGASIIPVVTSFSDFDGDKILLWQDDETCEVLDILSMTATQVLTATPTSRSYTNALACPVRAARCVNGLKMSRSVQPLTPISVEWVVHQGQDLGQDSETLYPYYRSHPVITDAARIGPANIDMDITRDQEEVDDGIAEPYYDAVLSRIDRSMGMGWIVSNAEDLWNLRRFLHTLKGRQKGFWLPSWSRGMQLVGHIVPASTQVTLLAIGLNGVAETGDIMFKKRNGSQSFMRYGSVTPSGNNEILNLVGTAGATIAPDDVRTFCRMHFCRALADKVELRHTHTGNGQITQVIIRAGEVPIP